MHHAPFEQDGAIAVAGDLLGGMGDEQDGGAARDQLFETAKALRLELGVAHGQCLVDDQHVGVDAGRHGKGQPHVHAGRIRLHRPVDELADVGKGLDVGKAAGDFLTAHAQDGAIEVDVLAPGKLRVEARPQLQQRGHTTADFHMAVGGGERAAEDLQQGALAGTIAADDAHGFATAHGEVQPLQRPELAEILWRRAAHQPGHAPHQQLLEQMARAVVELEALGEARNADGHVVVQPRIPRDGRGLVGKGPTGSAGRDSAGLGATGRDHAGSGGGACHGGTGRGGDTDTSRRCAAGHGRVGGAFRGHRQTPCGCSGTTRNPAMRTAPCRR